MKRMLLVGLVTLALSGCNKSKPAEPTASEGQGIAQGGHRGGGHMRMCEAADADARIAKMQKCQSEVTAACNTQVYGSATPAKDTICGDKSKMRDVWKCVKEKYAGDKEKMHADRKKMRECASEAAGPEEQEE